MVKIQILERKKKKCLNCWMFLQLDTKVFNCESEYCGENFLCYLFFTVQVVVFLSYIVCIHPSNIYWTAELFTCKLDMFCIDEHIICLQSVKRKQDRAQEDKRKQRSIDSFFKVKSWATTGYAFALSLTCSISSVTGCVQTSPRSRVERQHNTNTLSLTCDIRISVTAVLRLLQSQELSDNR